MEKTIEKFTLEDGRVAERHVSVDDSSVQCTGDRVVEIYVEDKHRFTSKRESPKNAKKSLQSSTSN